MNMFLRCKSRQWKTFILWFPFDVQKMKLRKRKKNALQVNLGHFIKTCATTKTLKDKLLATGTCWVIMEWMFWYYSCYCKNYVSSAFQHRENMSYETFFLLSVSQFVSQVYLKNWKENQFVHRQEKKSYSRVSYKALKCHIRGNVLVLYRAQTGCKDFSLTWKKQSTFFCVFVVGVKRGKNDWGDSLPLVCSSSLLGNKHQGQLQKHT